MTEQGKPLPESTIKSWCFQIFQALDYMHKSGYFHRDLKPGDYQGINCLYLNLCCQTQDNGIWFSREYTCNWGSCESCGFWTC